MAVKIEINLAVDFLGKHSVVMNFQFLLLCLLENDGSFRCSFSPAENWLVGCLEIEQ